MSLRELSRADVFDRKISEVFAINEIEKSEKGSMDMQQQQHRHEHEHAIEFDVIEFWPVEHPMEPQDEDRPVKCPMPSSINDGKGNEERVGAESWRKRSELPETANKGIAVRAVRKRRHTLTMTQTQEDHIHEASGENASPQSHHLPNASIM